MNTRSYKNCPDSFGYACGYYSSLAQTKHKIVSGTKFFIAYIAYLAWL